MTYSAVSFDEVLDQFLKAKKNQAKGLEQRRKKLISIWQALVEEKNNH